MINLLLIVVLSALGTIATVVLVAAGWLALSVVVDVIEARRVRENERAVREAIERSGKR